MSCEACMMSACVTRPVQNLLREHDSVTDVQSKITFCRSAPHCLPAPRGLLMNVMMPVRQLCSVQATVLPAPPMQASA